MNKLANLRFCNKYYKIKLWFGWNVMFTGLSDVKLD